ncbi:MAG TPA: glycosyltransferase family 4 protein [Acidimicrobiales bacterium]|nr:glycosyltransferase family 4 protein [Acidimicrobiales bacterium]
MRLLFVVQRYGAPVFGGAEQCCREYATRMARRGHDVEVLTSCAVSYVDWANIFPPGTSEEGGVTLHRLPVHRPRDDGRFAPLNQRVVYGRKPVPIYLQRTWMQEQGPYVPEITGWLEERSPSFEAVIFFTYLYHTTWAGLPVASRLAPTLLHPTAHDEPPLYLTLFDTMFRQPHAFGFLTEEEGALVRRRFGVRQPSAVLGVGVELDPRGDEQAFRRRFGLEERPYLLFVGRVDPHKGSDELYGFFTTYKRRRPGPLALVVLGEPVRPLPAHPDVVMTGFVDETTKQSALAGTLALVQPSYFESFSMVLSEAWAWRKPAVVQGECAVLAGQARRSGGALPYRGFAEFEAAVDLLVGDPPVAAGIGRAGRRHAEERYRWDTVLSRYERQLEHLVGRGSRRPLQPTR